MKNQQPHLIKRYLLLALGLAVMAFGVAFSIKGALGTSPISSVPYVVSLFTPLTVGAATICMHCLFILLQILLLRRDYDPVQLMQLPVALVFGWLCDLGVWAIQSLACPLYWQKWIFCILGIVLVAFGVSCEVVANVVTLAGEGLILAISRVAHTKFPPTKVAFDVTLVIIACALSFLFLRQLEGVREGTVAAAVCVGLVSKQINKPLRRFEERFLSD